MNPRRAAASRVGSGGHASSPTSATRRRVAGGLAALALVGGAGLAGCGDDEPTTSGGPQPPTQQREGAAAATPPPAQASPAEVDQAFVRQMIPHHEMAVDMAETAHAKGEHGEIKTLAGDVVTLQTQEIADLRAAAKRLGVTPDAPMTEGEAGHGASMRADAATLGLPMDEMGMSMDTAALGGADPFDRAFVAQMTEHHEGAIAMAQAQLERGADGALHAVAKSIVAAQQRELAEMQSWNADWYGAAEAPASGGGEHSGHEGH